MAENTTPNVPILPHPEPVGKSERIELSVGATLRLVVGGLVLTALSSIVSVTVLALYGRPTPDALIGIGSAAVGALATLVARIGTSRFNGQ